MDITLADGIRSKHNCALPLPTPNLQPSGQLTYQTTVISRRKDTHKPQLRSNDTVQARENATTPEDSQPSVSTSSLRKELKSNWSYGKLSIAAGTIVATVTLAALIFLVIWYFKRERRAKRLRQLANQSQDPFFHSAVTLTEDSSKTLDDFLMKDVLPERTSLMFSRSRSPSVTFVIDEADRRNSTSKLYRNSYEASTNSLTKLDSLTRVSTDGTRPSLLASDLTKTTSNNSLQPASIGTPRASTCSTAPTTARSSQLWTTTTGTTVTELTSVSSRELTNSHTSSSIPSSCNATSGSGSSQLAAQTPNTSRTSSRISGRGHRPIQSPTRFFRQGSSPRKVEADSHRPCDTAVVAPVAEVAEPPKNSGQSPRLPSIPPTPSPLFRLSEA
ncbi:uncharacterized protein N7459_003541 [Penicillium hispanicum]|uniref:uncharacterized protein n=1 Tax=Penicillium hispanicum TaxID=1080232 RepID=UPI00254086FA|nr:uncharacterized protein N7459_003541 [Penicillium hispanicum]KAJ5587776.1 hypothetical protein N7459_003541 [Penicillium hispanicum]